MRDRLEEAFRMVEITLVTTHHLQNQSGQNFYPSDPFKRDVTEINQMSKQEEQVASGENCQAGVYNSINPIVKNDIIVDKSRTIATLSSTQETPLEMVKCARLEPISTGQFDVPAFRKPAKGSKLPEAVNQVDWNRLKMDNPPLGTVPNRQDRFLLRQSTTGTATSFLVESERLTDDRVESNVHDEMATLDTPCPSASNSRRGSRSSTSSDSSWKSQPSEIDAAIGIDEQFFRTCDAAATLVRDSRRPSSDPSISAGKSGTTVNLNGGFSGTITAKVSVIPQRQASHHVAPATSTYSGNPS